MWELDYKESWVLKNWCFWTVVLEKTLESPLGCKEIQPVHPKGDQSWVFIGRTMLKMKLQYFGHLMRRTDSFEKTLILGKIEGRKWRRWQRIRWHHWLNPHGFRWTLGVGDGQGGLVCCCSLGRRVGHNWVTELNWTEVKSLSGVCLFVTTWTVAYHAPPSVGFSRQEYWSGLPFPSHGDLPNPGIKPPLPYCRQTLYHLNHQGSFNNNIIYCYFISLSGR